MARLAGIFALGIGLLLSGCGGASRPEAGPSPSGAPGEVAAAAVSRDRSHYQNVIEMIPISQYIVAFLSSEHFSY